MIEIKLIKNKELVRTKWLELLKQSEFSSPFQTPEFYDLFNSVVDYSAEVFAIEEKDEYKSLVVVTVQKEKGIKGFFSLRGIVYGGPIIRSSENKYLELLLKGVKTHYKRKLIYLEIRNNFDYNPFLQIFENLGWNYNPHLNVQLDLRNKDFDSILLGMKYNRRREIKLSLKEGVIARPAKNEQEVKSLYKILNEMYLERVKLPLSPLSFFINLYKSDIGKVFVVLHNDKIIGGSFCIFYKNMTINTLYYTGLRGYHKKIFPTHIAISGVIEFAIEHNLKLVDFMGAGKPNINYGVRDYKLQFGGDLVEYGRFNIIFKPLLYKLGVLGLKLLSKIK